MSNTFKNLFLLFLILTFFGCMAVKTKELGQIELTYHDNGETSDGSSWRDVKLKEAFEVYWSSRFDGLSEATWSMEVPYFREMTSKKKYQNFIKAYVGGELIGVEIWSIEQEKNYLATIRCEISYRKNGESKKFFTKDKWVKVRNEWYHIVRDPILFPSSL